MPAFVQALTNAELVCHLLNDGKVDEFKLPPREIKTAKLPSGSHSSNQFSTNGAFFDGNPAVNVTLGKGNTIAKGGSQEKAFHKAKYTAFAQNPAQVCLGHVFGVQQAEAAKSAAEKTGAHVHLVQEDFETLMNEFSRRFLGFKPEDAPYKLCKTSGLLLVSSEDGVFVDLCDEHATSQNFGRQGGQVCICVACF
jgi:hypothetical protein